jgi:hypothetical protein
MDHRRLAAMEPGTLHQSFLSAERKTSRTQRRYRDRGTTPNGAGGGDYLRLWAGVCEVLFGEWRLPLRSMPQKESSSSPENSLPRTDQISWWSQLRGFDSLPFASTVVGADQDGKEAGQRQSAMLFIHRGAASCVYNGRIDCKSAMLAMNSASPSDRRVADVIKRKPSD